MSSRSMCLQLRILKGRPTPEKSSRTSRLRNEAPHRSSRVSTQGARGRESRRSRRATTSRDGRGGEDSSGCCATSSDGSCPTP
eukprot:13905793-Heterocapsa_arctica.AAC.1